MRKRGAARIHFDQIRFTVRFINHEIEAEKSGQTQSTRYPFCCEHHRRVVHNANNNGRTGRSVRTDHLDTTPGQYAPLPAKHGRIRRMALNVRLHNNSRPRTLPPRTEPEGVAVNDQAFEDSSKPVRPAHFREESLGLRSVLRVLHTASAKRPIGLQYPRKRMSRLPGIKVFR